MSAHPGQPTVSAELPAVVLRLLLSDADLITGHVTREDGPDTLSFCGWMDLMSAVNILRASTHAPQH